MRTACGHIRAYISNVSSRTIIQNIYIFFDFKKIYLNFGDIDI